eukprot:1125486-Karenia_brevis.AAC.1
MTYGDYRGPFEGDCVWDRCALRPSGLAPFLAYSPGVCGFALAQDALCQDLVRVQNGFSRTR